MSSENLATTVIVQTSPTKEKTPLVELKNSKLVFKQKPLSFDKLSETLQEIVQLRDALEQRILSQQPPLTSLPVEHLPVIAKLVHESDKTISALSKHVHKQFIPLDEDDDSTTNNVNAATAMLPVDVVESAIKSTASRINYGLDNPLTGGKVPAAFCVWRWEVNKDHWDWLPSSSRDKAEIRLAERVQAKQDLAAIFDALPQQAQDDILVHKSVLKQTLKDKSKPNTSTPTVTQATPNHEEDVKDTPSGSKKNGKRKADDVENTGDEPAESTPTKAGRPRDPEKSVRDKEKLEKKAERVEREKKEQAANTKARSLMANFFGKPKPAPATEVPSTSNTSLSPQKAIPSLRDAPPSTQSEFERTFKSFVVKKDAHLAHANWFTWKASRKGKTKFGRQIIDVDKFAPSQEPIAISDDDDTTAEVFDVVMSEPTPQVTESSIQARLASTLTILPHSLDPRLLEKPPRADPSLKTTSIHSVRHILACLSEAEVAGDTNLVRSLTALLTDRSRIPARVFIFDEDLRPGYYGTFTRSSRIVGARSPFARDEVALDYACDSGVEWDGEEEGAGEDVADGEEEEQDGDEERDSDLDSWLVDDDEVEEEVDNRSSPFPELAFSGLSALPPPAKKRKVVEEETQPKKKKVVVPLVPFTKGPCLESKIGQCAYEPFAPYRIQLFNDTPFPIDPFSFMSTAAEDMKSAKRAAQAIPEGNFAVPALPERLANGTASLPPPLGSSSASADLIGVGSQSQRTANAPAAKSKHPFPDAHLPVLLSKIDTLATGSFMLIVESVWQDLKPFKVTKGAIDAKIREVGEKCKEKKIWIVKPEVRAVHA